MVFVFYGDNHNDVESLFQNIKYTKIMKDSTSGLLYSNIVNDDKQQNEIIIQSSRLKCLTNYENNTSELEVELHESDNLYKLLKKLDMFNLNSIHKNSKSWFGKSIPMNAISEMYKPIVQTTVSNDSYVYTCSFILPHNDKNQLCIDIYNNNKENIGKSYIKENTEIYMLLELNGLVFYQNKAIFNIVCQQIKVNSVSKLLNKKSKTQLNGFSFKENLYKSSTYKHPINYTNLVDNLNKKSKLFSFDQEHEHPQTENNDTPNINVDTHEQTDNKNSNSSLDSSLDSSLEPALEPSSLEPALDSALEPALDSSVEPALDSSVNTDINLNLETVNNSENLEKV